MKIGTILWLSASMILAQDVSPYPDTSVTGTVAEMMAKVARAQAELEKADREIADNQRKFDGLERIKVEQDTEFQKLDKRADQIVADWKEKKDAFNQTCSSHTMRLDSAEYANCIREQARLQGISDDYDRESASNTAKRRALSQEMLSDTQNQLLCQVQIQKLKNWKSQVEPGIRGLKAAIATQCKELLKTASPEELKYKCGNIQFDNAPLNLPPCTTDACIKQE